MPSPLIVPKFRAFDANGDPLNGGKLYAYAAGTSTPQDTYTTAALTTANANPVVLDANGEADVWLGSSSYKFVLKNSADVTQWTVDNVLLAGVAAVPATVTVNEWTSETNSVSWVAATQFKVVGADVTATYHVGRRVKIVHNTGATTSYGTVTASSFSSDTTITVSVDGGTSLASTVTAVSYGLASANANTAIPAGSAVCAYAAAQTGIATSATKIQYGTEVLDYLGEYDAATNYRFTATYAGRYKIRASVVGLSDNDINTIQIYLYKNGSPLTGSPIHYIATTNTEIPASIERILSLAAGDYIEAFLKFNQGAANATVANASELTINRIF